METELKSLFKEETNNLLLKRTRFLAKLGPLLYILFWGLDLINDSSTAYTFLTIRIAVFLFSMFTLYLCYTPLTGKYLGALSMIYLIIGAFGISVMCSYLNGFESDYYVGIMLVLFASGFFMPWNLYQIFVYCITIVLGHYLIIIANGFSLNVNAVKSFFFLSSTSVFACSSVVLNQINRKKELSLRYRLEKQKEEADNARKEVEEAHKETKIINEELTNVTSELEHANTKLKESDKQKTAFFQNITHEFRTPLTLIIGPLEQFLTSDIRPELKSKAETMLRNARRLLRLINQLLDLSKLESGKMNLKCKEIDLKIFLKNIVSAFDSKAKSKKIDLDCKCNHDEVLVYIDQEKMDKVIFNLLSNSFKFTESGSITISLDKSETQVFIKIKDTGKGIPDKELPHIFDRFRQVDGTTTREQEGTGIGLSLVKEYVELHKGSVEVTSKEGDGTEFTISLPTGIDHLSDIEIDKDPVIEGIKQDERNLSGLPELNEEGEYRREIDRIELIKKTEMSVLEQSESDDPIEQTEIISDETLLIVDDNADMRSFIKSVLENNYNIIEAKDGLEGLNKANTDKPDLIISDVMMPIMDGNQMLSELKMDESTSNIPVIMLTAKATEDFKLEGLESGAADYLAKPFNPRELLARVNNILTIKRQAEEIKRNIETILEKQFKLIMAGEMMGDLFHDMKNIFGQSSFSVSSIKSDVIDIFKLLELTDNWDELVDIMFKKSDISNNDKIRRSKLLLKSVSGMKKDRIESMAGRMFTDNMLVEFSKGIMEIDEGQREFYCKFVDIAELFDLLQHANKQAEQLSYSVLNQVRGESESDQECDISSVVDSCITMMGKRFTISGIKTEINVASANVGISAPNLHTVILNLLNNSNDALKKLKQDDLFIKIYSEQKDDSVNVVIEDNGPGIPENIQNKIFERNFSTKGQKGNGIGLAVCRSLVEKVGGNIELFSKPESTKFKVKLPLT